MWDKEEWARGFISSEPRMRPSNSAKRNQERAIKRMAQRSRAINRMKRK
jgi:hypothetical protein